MPHALSHSAVKNWWNKITASLSDRLIIFFSLACADPDQLNTGNYQLTYTLNVINPLHLIISSQLRTNTLSHKTPTKICTSFWQGRPFSKCNQQAVSTRKLKQRTCEMRSEPVVRHLPRGWTTWSTSPIFLALSALMVLPVSIMSRAVGMGSRRGNRWVPPAPGNSPSMTSGTPRPVFLSATAMR